MDVKGHAKKLLVPETWTKKLHRKEFFSRFFFPGMVIISLWPVQVHRVFL